MREQYVSTLILKLAYEIEQLQRDRYFKDKQKAAALLLKPGTNPSVTKVSVLFWNRDKKFDKFTLDPNYLVRP